MREREKVRMREKVREREKVSERERERERDVEYGYCIFIFIFKRNDRCLGTFKLSSITIVIIVIGNSSTVVELLPHRLKVDKL